MRTRSREIIALAGWLLLYSRQGTEWTVRGEYPASHICTQAMTGLVDQETQGEIGGALAGQDADNPLRQDAYRRAARRVQERYRCAQAEG